MNTNTCLIPLTQGKYAIVNPEDYEFLSQFKWCAQKSPASYGYRWRAVRGIRSMGVSKLIYMHREVAKLACLPDCRQYDHWDRNGLNNTRENLRPCTNTQNHANSTKSFGKSSRFKGVSWDKRDRKWQAYIKVNRRKINLGYFIDESDAAKAYAEAAFSYYGEFACW